MSWKAIFEWLTRATAEAKQDEANPDLGPVVIVDPPSVTYPKPEIKVEHQAVPLAVPTGPVKLFVESIRDGKTGVFYSLADVLSGKDTLKSGSNVVLVIAADAPADGYSIEWRLYATGVLVGKFVAGRAIDDGTEREMGPWILRTLSLLEDSNGASLVVRWRGVGTQSSAEVEAVVNGTVSNRIVFPRVD